MVIIIYVSRTESPKGGDSALLERLREQIMKIWQYSGSGPVRSARAAVLTGAVLMGFALPAQASLIGDTITIQSGIPNTTCNSTADCSDTVMVDGGVELMNQDGSDFAGALDPFEVLGSVDVGSESISIFIDSGGVFTFIFSDLQWIDPADGTSIIPGMLTAVTEDPTSNGTLTNFTVTDLMDDSFRVVLDCNTVLTENPCDPSTPYVLALDVDHPPPPAPPPGGPPPGGPPPGANIPEPGSMLIFLIGLAGLTWMVRRRRRVVGRFQ